MASESRAPLTATERAIIESIRRGAPDAEIAARLGIPVGDVKVRIERLRARFGRTERSGLATVDVDSESPEALEASLPPDRPSTAGNDGPPARYAADEQPVPIDSGSEEPTYSRRAVLAMIGAGAATLGGVGAYFLTGRGDSGPTPARPDPFATNTPRPTSTPPPTRTPHPGLGAIEPAPDAWVRLKYADGEPIDVWHGVGFVDTTTGETEVIQLSDDYGEVLAGHEYAVSLSNDLVAVSRRHTQRPRQYGALLRRSTGQSFAWNADIMELAVFTDEVLVFHRYFRHVSHYMGVFDIVDTNIQPISQVEISLSDSGIRQPQFVISGNREHLAIIVERQIHFIHVASGDVTVRDMPRVEGRTLFRTWIMASDQPDGFAVAGSVTAGREDRHYEIALSSGGEVRSVGELTDASLATSPDGRYRIRRSSLRQSFWPQDAAQEFWGYGFEDWIYTEMLDAGTGESYFRVLSGSSGGQGSWLADSSGFVLQSRAQEPALENFEAWLASTESYLVGTDGSIQALHPQRAEGPALHPQRRLKPSPEDPDIFSVDGVLVWYRAQNRIVGPAGAVLSTDIEPWGLNGRELRFVFPPDLHSHGWPGPSTMVPPTVERPPYRAEVTLQVARAGTCVFQRGYPSLDGEVLDCLRDGTRLTLVPPAKPPYSGAAEQDGLIAFYGTRSDEGVQMFVHVRTEAGQEGWVAIQYLDWAE